MNPQTTHQVNRSVDSPVTCYARTDAGRLDLSEMTLDVVIRPYGGQRVLSTVSATGSANGRIDFTVPTQTFAGIGFGYDYGLNKDPRNLVRFDVMAGDALVYQALMEVA